MAGCVWLQKAPGVSGMGPFNSPTSGGPRGYRHCLSQPCPQKLPRLRGSPGGGPGMPGSGQSGVPVWQGRLGEAEFAESFWPLPRGPSFTQRGWGLEGKE